MAKTGLQPMLYALVLPFSALSDHGASTNGDRTRVNALRRAVDSVQV